MKKWILLVLLLLVSCANQPGSPNVYENQSGKGTFKTLGEIYTEQDWIYFTNFYDQGLYRVSQNGKVIHKISTQKDIVRMIDDDLYYMENQTLYRENINTKQKASLGIQGEVLYIDDDIVVFADENGASCVYDFDSKKTAALSDQIGMEQGDLQTIDFENGWLYFANAKDENKLYKLNVHNKSFYPLTDDMCGGLSVSDDVIYYTNASDGYTLYRIDVDGENKTKLNDDRYTFYFEMDDDMIYYANYDAKSIYRMDLSGNNVKKITDDHAIYFCVEDDFIYYSKIVESVENDAAVLAEDLSAGQALVDERNSIYRISIDGGVAERIL